MIQSRASGLRSKQSNNRTKRLGDMKTHLERANYMLGGDSFLRVLLTDLVRLGRNEMYEF